MSYLAIYARKLRSPWSVMISALFYLVFSWGADYSDAVSKFFFTSMFLLPGITFPLVSCNYDKFIENKAGSLFVFIHVLLSTGLYYGCVWIWTAESLYKWAPSAAGFTGSFVFLVMTKYFLQQRTSFVYILLAAIVSGASFLFMRVESDVVWLGMAVFCWTLVNGWVLLYGGKRSD